MQKFELHLAVSDASQTPLQMLKQHCELSTQQIKDAIDKGALWHEKRGGTHRLRRVKKKLGVNEQLHFYYNAEVLSKSVDQAILIEDHQGYSIWYKPYGMLCQGSKWSDHCTINRFVEKYFEHQRLAFMVHRLDRAASGLIIIAHSKKIARALSQYFEQRQLEKQYQIISHGRFNHSEPLTVTSPVDGKAAQSRFSLLDYDKRHQLSLLAVDIASGRKHQIRIHAATAGFPVVGDRLHGDCTKQYPAQLNLQLCAVKLVFVCPITEKAITVVLDSSLSPLLATATKLLD